MVLLVNLPLNIECIQHKSYHEQLEQCSFYGMVVFMLIFLEELFFGEYNSVDFYSCQREVSGVP